MVSQFGCCAFCYGYNTVFEVNYFFSTLPSPQYPDDPFSRYDVRLLLDILAPPLSEPSRSTPSSPTGWSDLPSDTEDTFFFSPEEVDDYRRDKKRRLMDKVRQERLKARAEEDGEDIPSEEDIWGGSDEEVSVKLRHMTL